MTTKIYPLNDTEYQSITEFEGSSTYEVVTTVPENAVVFSSLADYTAKTQYSKLRKAKYDLLNQDEMRFDDQVNSTTTWVDAINAIKAAHPKP